jgi:ATP-dependent Clp protease ATP-binding subunit ClpA
LQDHHGVHITDRALVVAAELSDRYITGRFLPDKAIDLMDEACSNVRVQLDSKPENIDSLERQRVRLQVRRGEGVVSGAGRCTEGWSLLHGWRYMFSESSCFFVN